MIWNAQFKSFFLSMILKFTSDFEPGSIIYYGHLSGLVLDWYKGFCPEISKLQPKMSILKELKVLFLLKEKTTHFKLLQEIWKIGFTKFFLFEWNTNSLDFLEPFVVDKGCPLSVSTEISIHLHSSLYFQLYRIFRRHPLVILCKDAD